MNDSIKNEPMLLALKVRPKFGLTHPFTLARYFVGLLVMAR